MQNLLDRLADLAAIAADLDEAITASEDAQWRPSVRSPVSRAAGHADPTGDTAVDPRRLALREAYEKACAAVEQASEELGRVYRNLSDARDVWAGE